MKMKMKMKNKIMVSVLMAGIFCLTLFAGYSSAVIRYCCNVDTYQCESHNMGPAFPTGCNAVWYINYLTCSTRCIATY
jgi:hypothetical protein